MIIEYNTVRTYEQTVGKYAHLFTVQHYTNKAETVIMMGFTHDEINICTLDCSVFIENEDGSARVGGMYADLPNTDEGRLKAFELTGVNPTPELQRIAVMAGEKFYITLPTI